MKKKEPSNYRYSLSNSQKQKHFLYGKKLSKHKHFEQKSQQNQLNHSLSHNLSNLKQVSIPNQKVKQKKKKQKQNKIYNSNVQKIAANIKRHSSSLTSYELAVLKQKRSNGSILIHEKSNTKIKANDQTDYSKPQKLDKTVKKQKSKVKQREKYSAMNNFSSVNQTKQKIKNPKNDIYRSISAENQQNLVPNKSRSKKKKLSTKYNTSCIDLKNQSEFNKQLAQKQNNNEEFKKKKKKQVLKNKQSKKKQSFTFANVQIKMKKSTKIASPSKNAYNVQYTKNCNLIDIKQANAINYIKNLQIEKYVDKPSNFIKKRSKSKPQISLCDLNSTKIKQKSKKIRNISPKVIKISKRQKLQKINIKQLQQAPYFLILKQGQTPQSQLQFPVNKYEKYNKEANLQKTVKNKAQKNQKSKSRSQSKSKSRKNSSHFNINKNNKIQIGPNSLQKKQKSSKKLFINASSLFCYSDSDQIYNKSDFQQSQKFEKNKNKNKKESHISNILNIQNSRQKSSINLKQIEDFQNQNKKCQNSKADAKYSKIIKQNFHYRQDIIKQIQDDYSLLTRIQLQFLASVIFIQRKWRQKKSTFIVKTIIQDILNPNLTQKRQQIQKSFQNKQDLIISQLNISKDNETEVKSPNKNNQKLFFSNKELVKKSKQEYNNSLNASPIMKYNLNMSQRLQENINIVSSASVKHKTQEDTFPQVTYLQIKKELYKKQYLENLQKLQKKFLQDTLSKSQALNFSSSNQIQSENEMKSQRNQFQFRKEKLKQQYKLKLSELSNSKKIIKQSCLKYIQCVNKTKEMIKFDGLRRVSSQEGMMTILYNKVYKLDFQMHSSDSSQLSSGRQNNRLHSLQDQYDQKNKFPSIQNMNKNICMKKKKRDKIQKTEGQLLNLQKSNLQLNTQSKFQVNQKNNQSQQIKQTENSSTLFNISKLLTISESQLYSSHLNSLTYIRQKQVKTPNQLEKNKKQDQDNFSPQIQTSEQIKMQNQFINQSYQHNEREIFLQDDEFNLDNVCFEDVYFKMDSLKINQQSSGFEFNESANFNYKIPNSPKSQRIDRENIFTSKKGSQLYIHQFLQFMMKKANKLGLIQNLNKYQGFQPLGYLNFLRTFQVPDDEFTPIIQNERFIEWEQEWLSKNDTKSYNQMKMIQDTDTTEQLLNQSLTIFHRSLFQIVANQFEKFRIFGQKGRPFPWQTSYLTQIIPITFTQNKIKQICQKVQKISIQKLSSECGIIQQNHHLIISQEDLQQLHDKNQDRIIQALQNELKQSPNCWYQIDQHILQIKIQISEVLWEQLLQQLVFQNEFLWKNCQSL